MTDDDFSDVSGSDVSDTVTDVASDSVADVMDDNEIEVEFEDEVVVDTEEATPTIDFEEEEELLLTDTEEELPIIETEEKPSDDAEEANIPIEIKEENRPPLTETEEKPFTDAEKENLNVETEEEQEIDVEHKEEFDEIQDRINYAENELRDILAKKAEGEFDKDGLIEKECIYALEEAMTDHVMMESANDPAVQEENIRREEVQAVVAKYMGMGISELGQWISGHSDPTGHVTDAAGNLTEFFWKNRDVIMAEVSDRFEKSLSVGATSVGADMDLNTRIMLMKMEQQRLEGDK